MTDAAVVLSGLTKHFTVRGGWRSPSVILHAVESVSLDVHPGKTLGVVGESGCGKSTLGRMVAGLIAPTEGDVEIHDASGRVVSGRDVLGSVQMVFQDPLGALDPRMSVLASVMEPLAGENRAKASAMALDMLEQVGVDRALASRKPHQLSGGQQQRVCIARTLVAGQRVVVLDEVVSALDPIVRAQILDLLARLQREFSLTYLFISHDLYAVHAISDEVAVMYLGELVEFAPMSVLKADALQHPYSIALLSSKLDISEQRASRRVVLKGDVPSPLQRPTGCVFRTRCPIARDICADEKPKLRDVGARHRIACHFAGELTS